MKRGDVARAAHSRVLRFFELLPAATSVVALVVGVVILTGWILERPALKSVGLAEAPMWPVTALCLSVLAAALILAQPNRIDRTTVWVSRVLAAFVFIVGMDHALADVASAQPFLYSRGADLPLVLRGLMPADMAGALVALALGIVILPRDRKARGMTSQLAAALAFVLGFLALIGYAFGMRDFYRQQVLSGMSLVGASCLTLLAVGLLFSNLERGLPARVVDDGAAGVLTRRLLPGTILLPFAFGAITLAGERAGLYAAPLAMSLVAVANIVTFMILVSWSARVVQTSDQRRADLLVRERRALESSERARSEAETASRDAESARSEAESASRAKSDFLAVMSHELRTPLTAIMGYQELLADGITGPINEGQAVQLNRIRSSAHHLLNLIDEILTFTRTDVLADEAVIEPVKLRHLIAQAEELVATDAARKKLELRIELPPEDVVLESDATKVTQMMTNLLSNAIKFTEQGTVRLWTRLDDGRVLVHVSDTGEGIRKEHLSRVFEPFWQAEQRPTRRVGGTGLGLTVTRRLARLLGGDVSVESEFGKGATFTLTLPLHSAANTPLIARAAAVRAGET